MKAVQLENPQAIETNPLKLVDLPEPSIGTGQLRVRVTACGICHTDLHNVEGEIIPPKYPIIPGHQIIGRVVKVGSEVEGWESGERVGIPWLYGTCGECAFCRGREENLCQQSEFTGFHRNGGYAEFVVSNAAYSLRIPEGLADEVAAPLLCAGIIGFRSLHKADVHPGERLSLVGFGMSAHLAI